MVNHPNRSRKGSISKQLKALLSSLSDANILDLASGRAAMAVFPKDREAVQFDSYFASDCPDGAAEEYWRDFGPRAVLTLDVIDDGLYELPLEWREELAYVIENTPLASHGSVLNELLALGLAAKAAAIRRKLLASNLDAAIEDALDEVRAGED